MARREDYKMKDKSKGGMLSPEKKIIQKSNVSYKSRYEGLLAPEDKIVQKIKPSYKDDRYK